MSDEKKVSETAPHNAPEFEARPQSDVDREMFRERMLKRFENTFVDLAGTEHEASAAQTKKA